MMISFREFLTESLNIKKMFVNFKTGEVLDITLPNKEIHHTQYVKDNPKKFGFKDKADVINNMSKPESIYYDLKLTNELIKNGWSRVAMIPNEELNLDVKNSKQANKVLDILFFNKNKQPPKEVIVSYIKSDKSYKDKEYSGDDVYNLQEVTIPFNMKILNKDIKEIVDKISGKTFKIKDLRKILNEYFIQKYGATVSFSTHKDVTEDVIIISGEFDSEEIEERVNIYLKFFVNKNMKEIYIDEDFKNQIQSQLETVLQHEILHRNQFSKKNKPKDQDNIEYLRRSYEIEAFAHDASLEILNVGYSPSEAKKIVKQNKDLKDFPTINMYLKTDKDLYKKFEKKLIAYLNYYGKYKG